MKMLKIVVAFLVVIGGLCVPCLAKSWNGIVPLVTTRTEVEKKLGLGEVDYSTTTYRTKTEKIFITYSPGICSESTDSRWDVPKDTVVFISVNPIGPFFIRDLGENIDNFVKTPGVAKDLPGMMHYRNDEDGISFNVDMNAQPTKDVVTSINYYAPNSEDHRACPKGL